MSALRNHNKKAVFAWCLYDFANSAFMTLVVTFIYSTYFTKAIAENEIVGAALWSRGVTISALLVAFLSPVMGALADRGGYRKRFLVSMTAISVLATAMLYTPLPGQTIKALFWFVIANTAFEMAFVFYNAYLPDIALSHRIGRMSGYGWSLGFVGGLLCMLIAMIGFINTETPWFGFSTETGEHIRAANLLTAAWFAFFSIPIFIWIKDTPPKASRRYREIIVSGFRQLRNTFREVKRYRRIIIFLIARLIYNDGLITVFAFAGIYAAGTYHFTMQEIMMLGVGLNIAAAIGAFGLGFLDDRIGGKKTVQISLIGLILAAILAVFGSQKWHLWAGGVIAGIFSGPNQAASRSLMGRLVPREKENEFFGFYAFSGKATSFLGPLLFGILTERLNTQRAGMFIVILFFICGSIILTFVNEKEGRERSKREYE
ncbi:MAG: MFS transporter [Candidatus Omnitrophota bacterium]|jgi:UMF1 family MFS transporter|nr:MAG: MFS transporter [Candidatus Omnitrophota bacterium]